MSAVLLVLSFPPADLGVLAWVALVPLFWAMARVVRARRAFALGYLLGAVFWGALTPWIGTTVVRWAATPLGWAAWVGLTGIQALWFGLAGLLLCVLGRRTEGAWRVVSLAAAWTLVEWLRTQGGLSMPWGLLGYTQHRFLPAVQVASLGGVYLVTFTLALVAAAIAEAAAARRPRHLLSRAAVAPLLLAAAWLATAIGYGVWALQHPVAGLPAWAVAVQPNLTSERVVQRTPEEQLARLMALAGTVHPYPPGRDVGPPLMVWPESTSPTSAITDPAERAAFASVARATGAWQVVGTGYDDERDRPHNSAAIFAPDGSLVARYDKAWLVPYGEWIPGRRWMPFGSVFHFIEKDVVPGTGDEPIAARAPMSPLICYESVFPQLARRRVARGAELLVSITNDSWAGRSSELAQHAQMTAMRAVETRRWVIAAATTGITALIAPDGRVTALPPYRTCILEGAVGLVNDLSPYVRWGDWLVALCALWVAAVAWRKPGARPRNGPSGAAVDPPVG